MAQFKAITNTDKDYPCTQCGSSSVSIIREDPAGHNPRLKCGSCGFMFNGADSAAAAEAGEIKASSADALANATEPERSVIAEHIKDQVQGRMNDIKTDINRPYPVQGKYDFPTRPAYMFIAKDSTQYEAVAKKDFKKAAIKWSVIPHSCYELKKIALDVKVDVTTPKE
jgi:ribosomal protein S27AE